MNEAPCRCRAFIETEAQMQERLPSRGDGLILDLSQDDFKRREGRGEEQET